MSKYCFGCGNKIKKGHNKKWNNTPEKAVHIDDVCECIDAVSQYSKEGTSMIAGAEE